MISEVITASGGEEALAALAKVDSLVEEDVPDKRRISGDFERTDGASVPDRPEMPESGCWAIRPVFSNFVVDGVVGSRVRRRRFRDFSSHFRGRGSGGKGSRGGC